MEGLAITSHRHTFDLATYALNMRGARYEAASMAARVESRTGSGAMYNFDESQAFY
jgi:hypothetical protein